MAVTVGGPNLSQDQRPYGPTERWLTVVSPEDPDGVELVLHLTDEPARAFQQTSRAPSAGRCSRCAATTAGATRSGSRPQAIRHRRVGIG
jgi:hypothetical protein